ncbi:hypothetical protein STEG23_012771 [Scotinomys teguina]
MDGGAIGSDPGYGPKHSYYGLDVALRALAYHEQVPDLKHSLFDGRLENTDLGRFGSERLQNVRDKRNKPKATPTRLDGADTIDPVNAEPTKRSLKAPGPQLVVLQRQLPKETLTKDVTHGS